MTLYVVFDPQADEKDRTPVLVAERFSAFAALLPPVFLIANGLFREVFAFALAIAVLVLATPVTGEAGLWLYLLLALFIGVEAPALRGIGLGRDGFIRRGELVAADPDLALKDALLDRVAP